MSTRRDNLIGVSLHDGSFRLTNLKFLFIGPIAMHPHPKTLILPLLLIVVGVGWLLSALGVAPGIDWLWTLGLASAGFLVFLVGGFNKFTVVAGPFFIVTSLLSVLRQTGRISFDVEIPILVILAGILLLVARNPAIPIPDWVIRTPKDDE